jgi:hypothetical protein
MGLEENENKEKYPLQTERGELIMAENSFRYDLTGKSAALSAFLKCDNEWRDAVDALSEYSVGQDFALQDVMDEKQGRILLKMARADLEWLYENYYSGQGKTEFRKKYLDTYGVKRKKSRKLIDDIAAAVL